MNERESTVKSRLIRFLQQEGVSNSEFARRMGVSVAYLGAMRKSMPEEKIVQLTQLFPNLNRDWLLYGEGEMYKQEEDGAGEPLGDYEVPLLPVEAFAGNLQMWSQGVALRDCEKVVSPVKGVDYAIRVSGDSMEPEIHNGSIVLIKRINDKAFIPWGNPMVIDSENGVLVKYVMPSAEGRAYIEAQSCNTRYAPIQIPTSSIYGLYRVLSIVRTLNTL